jgi:transcriptional regulator with XRE-family HTH domain
MTVPEKSTTIRHLRLASELRTLREARGLSAQEAADALGWSRPKLNKFETANRRPTVADVEEMLALYGCDEALHLALVKLTRNLHLRGWWTGYNDVLEPSLPQLESEATDIYSWQLGVVPGLLQTSAYALALIQQANPDGSRESHLRKVAARAARQSLLERPGGPMLHAVMDEAVLRRPVGGAAVMEEQLRYLVEAASRPNVCLQVMPLEAWRHSGVEGSFVLLGFGGKVNMDVVFQDGAVGSGMYLEDVEKVGRAKVEFSRISEAALSEGDSVEMIRGIFAA